MGEVQVTRRYGYRSLFWPMLLIGIGSVWLLVSLDVFDTENIMVLARLWPLLLIAAGLDLLVGRASPTLGAFIGVGAVVGMLLLMLIGPSIGLADLPELQSAQYEEVLGDAQSARIILGSGVNTLTVDALSEPPNLFTADVHYYGDMDYDVSGETEKTVSLKQHDDSLSGGFASFLMTIFGAEQEDEESADWNIGLSRDIPLGLDLDAGVGDATLDLYDLNLIELNVNVGVGTVDIMLPATEGDYLVDIDGGVGEVSITLPEGMAVRLDADVGIGSVDLPSSLHRVDGQEDDNFLGDEGVWETEDFRSASAHITIRYDGGVGDLKVR